MIEEQSFPWKPYITKPRVVKALQIGVDISIETDDPDMQEGDYLIQNPDPLQRMEAPFFLCPRDEFLNNYEAIPDAEGQGLQSREETEEGRQGSQECSAWCGPFCQPDE